VNWQLTDSLRRYANVSLCDPVVVLVASRRVRIFVSAVQLFLQFTLFLGRHCGNLQRPGVAV
jgi:hypothetical protein